MQRNFLIKLNEKIIYSLIYSGILGLWLNIGLLHKLRKEIQKDLLVANLAISNIGLCLFAMPLSSIASFQHE